MGKHRHYTQADQELAEELVAEGHSYADVGRKIGAPTNTIAAWVAKHGWFKPPSPSQYSKADKERARQMVEDGHSLREAARTIGCSHQSIRSWLGLASSGRRNTYGNCDRCSHPDRGECSSRWCACEVEIEVLGQSEDKLWARNGGRAALEMAY